MSLARRLKQLEQRGQASCPWQTRRLIIVGVNDPEPPRDEDVGVDGRCRRCGSIPPPYILRFVCSERDDCGDSTQGPPEGDDEVRAAVSDVLRPRRPVD
jgi:hypothetical protein